MLFSSLAAVEDRHAACVCGEEQRGLAGRVAGADHVDVQAVSVRGLAACRAVKMPLPERRSNPSIESAARPPRTRGWSSSPAGRRPVEMHLTGRARRCGRSSGSRGSRRRACAPAGAPARQPIARHARGETQVVLDLRRRAGLPARRFALDHDHPAAPPTRRKRRRRDPRVPRRRSRCRTLAALGRSRRILSSSATRRS